MGWLTFPDKKLERRFRAEQSEKRRQIDDIAVVFHLAPFLLAIVQAWRLKQTLVEKLILPISLLGNLVLLAISRFRPKIYTTHRTPLLLVQKCIASLLACKLGVIPTKAETSWLHFVQFEILAHGKGVPLFLTGLVLTLNFREMVVLQSLITAFYLLFNPGLCQTYYERLPENRLKYAHVGSFLNRLFGQPLVFKGLGLGSTVDPACAPGNSNCLRILAFSQISFGFVLPSLIVYAFEVKARLAFQRAHLRAPPKPARTHPVVEWACAGLAAVNLYIGVALLWHVLGWTLTVRR